MASGCEKHEDGAENRKYPEPSRFERSALAIYLIGGALIYWAFVAC